MNGPWDSRGGDGAWGGGGGPEDGIVPTDRDRLARAMVLAVHGLNLAALVVPLLPMILSAALVLANRENVTATWRSHMDDALRTAVTVVILALLSAPLMFVFLIGVIPLALSYMLLAYRSARGLLRALNWQPAA